MNRLIELTKNYKKEDVFNSSPTSPDRELLKHMKEQEYYRELVAHLLFEKLSVLLETQEKLAKQFRKESEVA